MAEESLVWGLWGTLAEGVLLLLYVMSISIAYVFGVSLHPIIMAGIAALIPYFSFWVLPIVLILFRAINDRDLYVPI